MLQTQRHLVAIAACLSFLAGYVDAIGFLDLGGFFVSFMSGNSTRLGVALAQGHAQAAATLCGIVFLFVSGVVGGSLLGARLHHRRMTVIMLCVASLLVFSALADQWAGRGIAIAALVLAMGAVNTLFERDGEVAIPITYMTGTLVRMGQRIAGALRGGPRLAWLRYLLLWCGLVSGAVTGAAAYAAKGFSAVWLAAAIAAAVTLVFQRKKL